MKKYLEFINEIKSDGKLFIQDGQDKDIRKEFPDYDREKSEISAEAGNDTGKTFYGSFLVYIYRKGYYKFEDGKLIKKVK